MIWSPRQLSFSPMIDYKQPDFYRFNQDSFVLINWIKKNNQKEVSRILDLGAGSGVLGIELANHFMPKQLTCLELQSEYSECLKFNLENIIARGIATEVFFQAFSEFKKNSSWDLIVCNPPYYLKGKGELPVDMKRAYARAFLKDGPLELLECFKRHLDPKGSGYIVVKNEPTIIREYESAITAMKFQTTKEIVQDLQLFKLNI